MPPPSFFGRELTRAAEVFQIYREHLPASVRLLPRFHAPFHLVSVLRRDHRQTLRQIPLAVLVVSGRKPRPPQIQTQDQLICETETVVVRLGLENASELTVEIVL